MSAFSYLVCLGSLIAGCRPGGEPARPDAAAVSAAADTARTATPPASSDETASSPRGAGVADQYRLKAAPAWDVKLPRELSEVSGLAFTGDGRLFAHGDQDATIWQLDARSGKVLKTFTLAAEGKGDDPNAGKKEKKKGAVLAGDFEDIQVVGDRFFLISSNGKLIEFREGGDGKSVPYTAYDTGLGKACEIEGLTADVATRSLLILCKDPHTGELSDEVVIFAWGLDSQKLEAAPRIRVPYAKIATLTGARSFHGSAIAFAPDRGSLILVAGPQKTFLELGTRGEVRGGGQLDAGSHRQPEGIAFAPDGTLLISDEGAEKRATLSGYTRH